MIPNKLGRFLTIQDTLFSFIDFYLTPILETKSIEQTKLKLGKKSSGKIGDHFLSEVHLIRKTLKMLTHKRKMMLAMFHPETSLEKTYLEVLRMDPVDCLILTSESLFQIPKAHLSLALKTSTESISFRRKQLLTIFEEEGIAVPELQKLLKNTTRLRSERVSSKMNWVERFQRLPLSIRFTLESGVVLLSLTTLLWIIPEVRNRYENSIQKRINDYLIESSLVDAPPPSPQIQDHNLPHSSSEPSLVSGPVNQAHISPTEAEEDNLIVDKSSSVNMSEVNSRKQPKVVAGETWRFSFTGTGPATTDIESAISAEIQRLNVATAKPTLVPGGIQFDFLIPVDQVIALKMSLERKTYEIQQKYSPTNAGSIANFSWYKKRNMGTRIIPGAHVQVIIWISTL